MLLRRTARAVVEGRALGLSGPVRWMAAEKGRATYDWSDAEKRRQFVEELRKDMGVKEVADWRQVRVEDIKARAGGAALLRRYRYSVAALLQETLSEEGLEAHEVRKKVPNGYWDSPARRRAFVERLALLHGVKETKDWKGVTRADVRKSGGASLLQRYPSHSGVFALLSEVYPGLKEEDVRSRRPQGYWRDTEKKRAVLDEVAAKFDVREAKDWQRVRATDIAAAGGGSLLTEYSGNIEKLLAACYPEYTGEELTQTRVAKRKHRWSCPEELRRFMEEIKRKHGVVEEEDWRKITTNHITEAGGSGLLQRHGNSVMAVLVATYGEEMREKEAVLRGKRSKAFWGSMERQRSFLDEVKEKHGVKKPEDWSRVSHGHLQEMGGSSLPGRYPSFVEMLRAVYPEEEFDELTCRPSVPPEYWTSADNILKFVRRLESDLKLTKKEDWYRVSITQIRARGGSGLLRAMRYVDVLRLAFPEEQWDEQECTRRVKKSTQRMLLLEVQAMLPEGVEVREDYWHPDIAASHGGKGFELDIFLPDYNVALEYNGEHHYRETGFFGPVEAYHLRDLEKVELCKQHGITLVVVPYWWDQTKESLAATLHKAASSLPIDRQLLEEIAEGTHAQIPAKDPQARARKTAARAGVWDERVDPSGMWQCARHEGVAVRYDPSSGSLLARGTRRKLAVPQAWLAQLPAAEALGKCEIDGDLWSAAHSVGQLSAALLHSARVEQRDSTAEMPSLWSEVKFMASDIADPALPFSQRLQLLQELPTTATFETVAYRRCQGAAELRKELEEDAASGGQGFLLRTDGDRYRMGVHTQAMLRAKHVSSAEAIVVERCKDARGLVVQLPTNGKLQVARCTGLEYIRPPPKGSRVLLGHLGAWASTGRLKYPFLLSTRP